MCQKSIKLNYIFNLLNTVTALLFPLITFPYVSRILFAEGIGQVQFFQSIIEYVSLCTSLGIPLYAVREIAKVRDNQYENSKTTTEILTLHLLLTLVGYIVVYILAITIYKISVDKTLFFLLSANLFLNALGVNWFYQAVEDFKYITIRTLLVRMLSLAALFLFVKSKDDILWYAGINVISLGGANLFNFIRLRKYIKRIRYDELEIKRHLRPAMQIFVLNLIISIYVNLDSVMLGFMKDESAVGFYTAAIRLVKTLLGVVTSLGAVLLPRFSNLLSNGKYEEFSHLANKAVEFIIGISLPMSMGLILLSAPIIRLFCGSDFDPSVLTMQLISPIILFISLSGILGIQILYPQNKEKIVIYATAIGAALNFFMNIVLIPEYGQYGAAIGTLMAEFSVLTVMIIIGKKFLPVQLFSVTILKYLVSSVVMSVPVLILTQCGFNDFITIILGSISGGMIYAFLLFIFKDPISVLVMGIINQRLLKK